MDSPENVIASVTSNRMIIEGAKVYLSGTGINMTNITGSDGIAYFYNVKATGPGNLTLVSTKNGYIHNSTNISVNTIK
jgi:hypothetical protein